MAELSSLALFIVLLINKGGVVALPLASIMMRVVASTSSVFGSSVLPPGLDCPLPFCPLALCRHILLLTECEGSEPGDRFA
jgi:hypothetical protein